MSYGSRASKSTMTTIRRRRTYRKEAMIFLLLSTARGRSYHIAPVMPMMSRTAPELLSITGGTR